jgi:hypothetical protein
MSRSLVKIIPAGPRVLGNPLNADDTGNLIEQIRSIPQAAGAYASDEIARAAEYLWPCK